MHNKFTQEDKAKLVQFLNMVASKAEFKMNTNEIIQYYKLLSFMQQGLLPKVEANILEIVKVVNPDKDSE